MRACVNYWVNYRNQTHVCGRFVLCRQNLADDSLPISPAISKVLVTPKGRRYLDDIVQKYPRCSATVQNSCLLCASVDEETLKDFKEDFEANIVSKTCKVRTCQKGLVTIGQHPCLLQLVLLLV